MGFKSDLFSGFIAKILFSATLFLVNVLIARAAGAAGSGNFFYIINNLSVIVLLSGLSLESGISYFLSKQKIKEGDAVVLSSIWSAGSALLVSGCILLIPGFFSGYTGPVFWPSVFFIAGNLLIAFFSGIGYAKKSFLWPQLAPALGNMIIIFYCSHIIYYREKADPEMLMLVFTGSYLAAGLLLAFVFFGRNTISTLHTGGIKIVFRIIIRYALIAFAANLAAFLMYRIDYWILESYKPTLISDAALGNYIQVAKLVQLFLFIPTVLATVIFPHTATGKLAGQPAVIKKSLVRLLSLNVLIIGVLLMTGRWLFTYIFGPDFSDMYTCFVYMSPGILAITCVRVLASYFAGLNQVQLNLAGTLLALGLIIALNFLLIPHWGINGAAFADSIGYMVYLFFLYRHFSKNNRV
jgi:O-antigen/teichoic acid export membrane protein